MPPPSCQDSHAKPSLLVALVCASIVGAFDRTWLSRPVCALIPPSGPRPEHICRIKLRVLAGLVALVVAATRRGRPPATAPAAEARRAPLQAALLTVATTLLSQSRVPLRRRAVQDQLVCAYDRLHAAHGATVDEFCAALALSARTFRSWRARPPAPPPPALPPALPPAPPRNDRATGRFDLGITAPGTQLGGDTTDLRVLGVDLKLVAAQDLGAREQRLWQAFALSERESADLVGRVVAEATAGKEGFQFVTDQGTPYLAQAAQAAYDALGVEHAPQTEGAPTEKATVERAFGTVKAALAPLLDLTNRLAAAVPALRLPALAQPLGTLLCAVFLRVYIAGRRHVGHPLAGKDPDELVAIVDEQRAKARAEDRSVRLFLEAVHAEYAMPGSADAFVRAFRRYPLDDLHEAERRFRAYACRCVARVCDRYFAAVVRDVHDSARVRRAAEWQATRDAAEARRARRAATQRTADLQAHPERRLHEGLDLLADTWQPTERRFLYDGIPARLWLRLAVRAFGARDPLAAGDAIEAHVRAWRAGRPDLANSVCDAVRGVLAQVITDLQHPTSATHVPAPLVGAILQSSTRDSTDNQRPSRPPHLRI